MPLTIRPLHPTLAAEVTGVDIAAGIDATTAAELEAANNRYPVLVLPGQHIDKEQQVAFAGLFGPLELIGRNLKEDNYTQQDPQESRRHFQSRRGRQVYAAEDRRRRYAGLGDSAVAYRQLVQDGAGEIFDALRRPSCRPTATSPNSPICAPPTTRSTRRRRNGSPTWSRNIRSCARAASSVSNISAEEQAVLPAVRQRVVRLHPGSQRMTLYLASHASHIVGWPIPEGRLLLLDLIGHATQPQFVYRHEWRDGDLVWWDDRCTMHRARAARTRATEMPARCAAPRSPTWRRRWNSPIASPSSSPRA